MDMEKEIRIRERKEDGCTLAVVAGGGSLPLYIAREAVCRGFKVYTLLVKGHATGNGKAAGGSATSRNLYQEVSVETAEIDPGQLQKLIDWLQERHINRIVMAGKVEKKDLFGSFQPDRRLLSLLNKLQQTGDDRLLRALGAELSGEGIEIIPQGEFLTPLLAPAGEELGPPPPAEVLEEMEFGFRVAKEIGRLDIGQTVVVKEGTVLAVEAVEGTDEAILRGAELGGEGIIVAKTSKPGQDLHFDLPTVGPKTMEILARVGARGLVVETERTLLVDREVLLRTAREAGIYFWALRENGKD